MRRLLAPTLLAAACTATPNRHDASPPPQVHAAAPQEAAPVKAPSQLDYPAAAKGEVVDDYHGVKIADPYRWLEDPTTPASRAWIEAENQLTFGYLDKLPSRARWARRLTELSDYERSTAPVRRGRWFFSFHNDGLQNQSVLMKRKGAAGASEVLLDPNALSKDGTVAITGVGYSDDGGKLAYALADAGSDWVTWHVRDVATGRDLPDLVRWSKFSNAAFTKDGRGFFYSRYPEPAPDKKLEAANLHHQIWFHALGTDQAKDQLVFEDPEHPLRNFDAVVSDDGRYLVIVATEGTDKNGIYYQRLGKPGAKVVRLIDGFDGHYGYIDNQGDTFLVTTDRDAPRYRVVAIDLKRPDAARWKTIIPEGEDKIASVSHVGHGLLVTYLHRATARVVFHEESGARVKEVALPGLGSVTGFDGKAGDRETFYDFSSFTTPGTVYRLDLTTLASTLHHKPKAKFDPDAYETRQVTYRSKDGTEVPMFLVGKKGLVKNGAAPTYLYAYGGFDISLEPAFSTKIIAWIEQGWLYAQPSLRGGGEFGEAWHHAGMREHKQNVFDDFAAAARFLVTDGWTRPDKIAISGRSNGGLLVGASLTQHPELFGAALAGVGVMDMLRFQKFTIGHAWVPEYGSSDVATDFAFLRAYSPLHNVKPGAAYPPTLVVTGDHDDRVVPAHSFKFAATLQAAQAGPAPVLIRIDTSSGHGGGKPLTKLIEEASDSFAFLAHAIGAE